MNADGSNQRKLRAAGQDGWGFQGHAEWSPRGDALVMFGGASNNPQIFTTDVNGQNAVQVTNRGGTNIDPSFSPDGRWILFVGCPQPVCYPTDYEIYAQSRSSSTLLRITNDNLRDHDPYLSPDGSTISWLTELSAGSWDVRIGNLAGAASRTLYGDGAVTSRAVWENSRTLLVHRLARGDLGFQVYRVNSDGSGSQRLTSGSSNEYPG